MDTEHTREGTTLREEHQGTEAPSGRTTSPAGRGFGLAASRWHRHPGVRTSERLTLGERAADRLRNGMGSWAFVLCALAFLALWTGLNGGRGFDPYPFILLNLLLSCLAALQGAILLIAARRSDQISSELALHDYETNCRAAEVLDLVSAELTEMRAEQARLSAAVSALAPPSSAPQ